MYHLVMVKNRVNGVEGNGETQKLFQTSESNTDIFYKYILENNTKKNYFYLYKFMINIDINII
jgi:hypothetical protein